MKKKKQKQKNVDKYSEEYIRKRREFPVKSTVIIIFCVIAQIFLAFMALTADEVPRDVIEKYSVTVEAMADGTLDIEYSFLWKALDASEELTWVEIGLPNENFTIFKDSVSDSVTDCYDISLDGYTGVSLDFAEGYGYGETVAFSFKVNQENMLCKDADGYFYEFVPCWFNSVPVEKYEFKWKITDPGMSATGARIEDGYYVWSGSFGCGDFETMFVTYGPDAFYNVHTVEYEPFNSENAYNELEENRNFTIVTCCLLIALLLGVEIFYLDSHVSYHRGRGFLRGYGHPIHTYGFRNPKYIRAHDRNHVHTTGRGGFRGGGCACACACACAGGGRAGCSQKDTYTNIESVKN